MARGWESKSVEEQQAERNQPQHAGLRLSAPQAARKRQIDALLLARKKIEHDIAATTHSSHREMLQRSLDHIHAKIADLSR